MCSRGPRKNADIAIPFASINPHRGAEGVAEARRLVAAGRVRGLKLHPPIQEFFPNDRLAYPLYEVFAEAQAAGPLPHRPQRYRHRDARRRRHPAEVRPPDADRRRGRGFSRTCRSSWPTRRSRGRTKRSRSACTSRRSTSTCRLVAEVLLADARAVREHAAEAQGALRIRLPDADAGPLDGRPRKIAIKDEVKPLILKDNAIRLLGLVRSPAGDRLWHRAERGRSIRHEPRSQRVADEQTLDCGSRVHVILVGGSLLGQQPANPPVPPPPGRTGWSARWGPGAWWPTAADVILRDQRRTRAGRQPWRSRRRRRALSVAGGRGRPRQRDVACLSQHAGAQCRQRARSHRQWTLYNQRGQVIARSVAELHGDTLEQARIGNFIGAANSLDEKGQPVPNGFPGSEHDILTGSTLDGRAYTDNTRDFTCSNWTSAADGACLMVWCPIRFRLASRRLVWGTPTRAISFRPGTRPTRAAAAVRRRWSRPVAAAGSTVSPRTDSHEDIAMRRLAQIFFFFFF